MLGATFVVGTACAKPDTSARDSTMAAAAASPAPAPQSTTAAMSGTSTAVGAGALTPIRGALVMISDTAMVVTTTVGPQAIHINAPLTVYTRTASDLAHVTPNAFVGITSVRQPNGTERATEIHIFPEELRGTGEGSRMMENAAASGDTKMTNGTAAPSRMTNGSVATSAGNASRMTNGKVSNTGGGTRYVVQYQDGTQTIEIPKNVPVTIIAPTSTKPTVGTNVIVLAHTATNGGLSTSGVMLSAPAKPQ
jgi:hypothetical protein